MNDRMRQLIEHKMEDWQKKVLKSHPLCNALRDHVEELCGSLFGKKIITKTMKERVLSQDTPLRQISFLLELLPTRSISSKPYKELYKACIEHKLKAAADLLEPHKGPHSICTRTGCLITFREGELLLPDAWPTLEHKNLVKNGKLQVETVTKLTNPEMFEKYQTHLNKRAIFPMQHAVRGNALIINIKTFNDPNLPLREGSEYDVLGLKQLFEGLGFCVKPVDESFNLNEEKINDVITQETKENHKNHDCFVGVFMSHGSSGGVLDTDGIFISMKNIISKFDQVEDLKTKPKLFFFQACQEKHNKNEDDPDEQLGETRLNEVAASAQGGRDLLDFLEDGDTFVFRSSTDGNAALRDTDGGSEFIQAIIHIFSKFAYRCEIKELCTKVNDLVSRSGGNNQNAGEFLFIPGKELYFFPGLYEPPSQ